MKLFLDDERIAPDGWTQVRWPDEAIKLLQSGVVTHLSLDHDLGDDLRGTGYDVLLWIEQESALHGFVPPRMEVHSANPSGRMRMLSAIEAITSRRTNERGGIGDKAAQEELIAKLEEGKPFNLLFDTEFTTLDSRNGYPFLISIGCVAEDGREYYAEVSDSWHIGLCSDFVIKNVLPLLNGGEYRMSEAQLAVRLKEWIEGLTDQQVILRSDCPGVDWPWVEQLFTFYGCWPKNLRRRCGVISFENDNFQKRFDAGLNEYWREHSARRHHALVDAKSLLFAWKFANRP